MFKTYIYETTIFILNEMKSANSFAKQLKRFVKEGNSTYNKSSILKNIKIQNIYSNDKINKKEHYIYFKEQDIKPNGIQKKINA